MGRAFRRLPPCVLAAPARTVARAFVSAVLLTLLGGLSASLAVGYFFGTDQYSVSVSIAPLFPPIAATVDINPDTLNPDSQGKFVMAYVELPEPWDVGDIDVSTVRLAVDGEAATVSAESHPTEVGDHDGDGIPDAMVKFDRQAVLDLLAGRAGLVTLVVTGQVSTRTFEGACTVSVLGPSPTPTTTPTSPATPSPTLTATPTPTDTPTAAAAVMPPSNLACTPTGLFSRKLQWQPSPLAESYRIYHKGPFWHDNFKPLDQVAAPATTYDEVWPSLFLHRWYVTALIGSWESGASNVIEVHCRPALFFPGPRGLDGENEHSQRIVTLSWEPTPNAALYGVFRAEQSGGPYELVGTAQDSMYDDHSVADGITYYYVVVAVDGEENESDPSAEIAVPDTAPAPSPTATAMPTAEPTVPATPTDAETLTPEVTATPTATTEPASTPDADS